MLAKFQVKTTARNQMVDITVQIQKIIAQSNISDGLCMAFVPHTTAAVTLNDSFDPHVVYDLTTETDSLVPRRPYFKHSEGNSDAHLKASLIGASENIIIADGSPLLGQRQGVYLWEFDGPRTRTVYVRLQRD